MINLRAPREIRDLQDVFSTDSSPCQRPPILTRGAGAGHSAYRLSRRDGAKSPPISQLFAWVAGTQRPGLRQTRQVVAPPPRATDEQSTILPETILPVRECRLRRTCGSPPRGRARRRDRPAKHPGGEVLR